MSPEDGGELIPLRDLRRSDWLLRALFVLLVLTAVGTQLQSELAEWLAVAPPASSR